MTEQAFKKMLKTSKNIVSVTDTSPKPLSPEKQYRKLAKQADIPKGLKHIIKTLHYSGINYVTEYRFHDVRQYRFDIAIPDKMIAIEYEGLNSEKSGHTTLKGYTKDTDKYNLAASLGWTVLRYTALNYKTFSTTLIQ
jgi:very-short-patch-repair endonuclease